MACPSCGHTIAVPKLGELRQLPPATTQDDVPLGSSEDSSLPHRAAFVLFGLVATASLMIAGFCGIRWALITVPLTTDQHIAQYRDAYQAAAPAELIREWESMEKYGVDLAAPYQYQTMANEKRTWGINTIVAGSVAAVSVVLAGAFGRSRRRSASGPTTNE